MPDEGAALLVCNHVSFMDPLIILGSIRRPVRFVMYYKIYKMPVMRPLFRAAKAIPIAGRKEDPEMMERAFDEVDRNSLPANSSASSPKAGSRSMARCSRSVRASRKHARAATRAGRADGTARTVGQHLQPPRFDARPRACRGASARASKWSIGAPIPAEQAKAAVLEARVRELRGDAA